MCLLIFIIILGINVNCGQFLPRTSDYDGYGLKIAGNDIMLIEALSDSRIFLVRFSPYDSMSQSLQCSIMYNDSSQYIYSIGIGQKQNSNQLYFFYAGEFLSNDLSNQRGTFIGLLVNKDPQNAQIYEDTQTLFNCNYFQYESIELISSYGHQEFFVFSVEPNGQYAIGLAADFVFIYRPFSNNNNTITIKNSSLVWPDKTRFLPVASDTAISYTIVVGFILNGPLFRVRATPTVYVISNSDLTILSKWSYIAALNSWQSYLTYSDLNRWSNKYVMSISINPNDPSEILVGIPFLNIAFLLIVSFNGTNLTLHSFIDNGDSIGFGKSVAWLPNSHAAILTSNYPKTNPSKISFYRSLNNRSLSTSPSVIFPNIQQGLPSLMNAHFIRMISTSNSLGILAINGEILLILSSPAGYFSSTSLSMSDSIIVVSQSKMCMAGTYKSDSGIFPCSLCPSGSRNPGNIPSISCISCSSDSFCPMGSVADIERSFLVPRSQAHVHPRSPELTVFDEILLQNMFSTSSTDHCILISPLFWVLIVIGVVFLILFIMGLLKRCVQHPKGHQVRHHVKKIFRQTDLINEGEMWIGGLFSVAIIVLLICAYTFSAAFYQEYPSENTGPSTFICGEIIRNVKYESGLQSLSIPISKEEQPMFDLLNQQNFILHLDFLNTIASCQKLSIEQIVGSSSTRNFISTCQNSFGILSSSIELFNQKGILKWIINDIAFIGAIRITLQAKQNKNQFYQLKQFDFSQTFYDDFNRTFSQTTNINLKLTKVINETEPLRGHQSKFSGMWYPNFEINQNYVFVSSDQYLTSINLSSTTLTIQISETSYYIKNRQLPIAKLREIIFHNLLFTIVCLEIFRLNILIWKLTISRLINFIITKFKIKNQHLSREMENVDQQSITDDDYQSTITTIDHQTIQVN